MLEKIAIIPATVGEHPVIQNMARFYVYDLAKDCGWPIEADGLYESFDFKPYFIDQDKEAFLIKINDELAGFVLLDKKGTTSNLDWNMGEFFIISKFQNKGYGSKIAQQIWNTHTGLWEVSVIPENKNAISFWRNTISRFTGQKYSEEIKQVDYDPEQPNRYIFNFQS